MDPAPLEPRSVVAWIGGQDRPYGTRHAAEALPEQSEDLTEVGVRQAVPDQHRLVGQEGTREEGRQQGVAVQEPVVVLLRDHELVGVVQVPVELQQVGRGQSPRDGELGLPEHRDAGTPLLLVGTLEEEVHVGGDDHAERQLGEGPVGRTGFDLVYQEQLAEPLHQPRSPVGRRVRRQGVDRVAGGDVEVGCDLGAQAPQRGGLRPSSSVAQADRPAPMTGATGLPRAPGADPGGGDRRSASHPPPARRCRSRRGPYRSRQGPPYDVLVALSGRAVTGPSRPGGLRRLLCAGGGRDWVDDPAPGRRPPPAQ
jgi:hypothetical protein